MSTLISLIIPIYKVEEYIIDCLNSIVVQIPDNVEVILINDGTPDNSMNLAIALIDSLPLNKKECFKILQQENKGQSVARNNALSIAAGEYIAFLDSDDMLEPNYFITLIEKIKLYNPDFIQFKSSRFKESAGPRELFHVGAKLQGFKENTLEVKKHVFNQSAWFPWLNIYKRNLFTDGDIFPAGVYYEDAALIPLIFLKAKNILFLSDTLYNYRHNPNGSLMGLSDANINKHIKSFKYVIDLYVERIKVDQIYSPSLVSLTQGYISFLLKHKGVIRALAEYKRINLKKKNINLQYLEKRGNILFYKYGLIFLLFTKLIGKD
ncbi:glycosyltransferase [Acinetobacter baumannii]|nr:glycosyltransferase [Acinetobacter baumannii]